VIAKREAGHLPLCREVDVCVAGGGPPRRVDLPALQADLRQRGAILTASDIVSAKEKTA